MEYVSPTVFVVNGSRLSVSVLLTAAICLSPCWPRFDCDFYPAKLKAVIVTKIVSICSKISLILSPGLI